MCLAPHNLFGRDHTEPSLIDDFFVDHDGEFVPPLSSPLVTRFLSHCWCPLLPQTHSPSPSTCSSSRTGCWPWRSA